MCIGSGQVNVHYRPFGLSLATHYSVLAVTLYGKMKKW